MLNGSRKRRRLHISTDLQESHLCVLLTSDNLPIRTGQLAEPLRFHGEARRCGSGGGLAGHRRPAFLRVLRYFWYKIRNTY